MLVDKEEGGWLYLSFFGFPQALSLFLLSAYYKFLGGFPLIAVASLLLYVGCYQVTISFLGYWYSLLNLLFQNINESLK